MSRRFNLNEKRAIVTSAYSGPGLIRSVAREHGIQPSQIRRWKKMLSRVDWASIRGHQLQTSTGRPPLMSWIEDELYDYIVTCRERGLSVSTTDILTFINSIMLVLF